MLVLLVRDEVDTGQLARDEVDAGQLARDEVDTGQRTVFFGLLVGFEQQMQVLYLFIFLNEETDVGSGGELSVVFMVEGE